jgi:S-DNA-T family DNA segregation ATPase FtsK/SpoIIIE
VGAARSTARRLGLAPGPAPWLPPLPARVRSAQVDVADADLPPAALPLALGDEPAHQRRAVVGWDPAHGHLAVIGRARSGRTTALLTLARAALERDWHVHALVPPSAAGTFAPLAAHRGFGTLAGPDDPRRAGRLLRALSARAPADRPTGAAPPVLVVVDGVEELRSVLAGAERWDPLTTALASGRAAFALSAEGATVGGVASRVGPRLVLLGTDKHSDVVLGAPSELAGTGGPPGRGAWLATDGMLACQVFQPEIGAPSGRGPLEAPLSVRPLPDVVRVPDLAARIRAGAPAPTEVVVGLGGDDAAPLVLDAGSGALVVGPRGSGRTALLRLVARRLARTGVLGGVVARDRDLLDDAAGAPSSDHSGAAVRDLLARLAGELGGEPRDARVLVVDDLDALAQTLPVEGEQLGGLAAQGWAVVASATTTGALLAHRGLLAELRGRRTGVVLAPGERGADEVFGTALADVADPGPPRPGRGALVRTGAVVPLQAALPDDARSVRGGLDDPARHEQQKHRGGDEHEPDAARDDPERSGAEERDADESLEDLPRHDGCAPASASRPQAAGGRDENGRDAEEEHAEEDADGHRAGSAADELCQHRAGRDADEDGLERDRGHDDAKGDRVRRRTGAHRLGGDDNRGHHTPRYVRPGVS